MPKNLSPAKPRAASNAAGEVAALTNAARRAPELERLEVFIGRWITEGETTPSTDTSSMRIVASDVYEWVPGRHFIMHPAYGRIGEVGVGGLEVIGFDPATGQYRTQFFDSQGAIITETLSYRDGSWTWEGTHARCTGVFAEDGKTLTAHHERSDDGIHWEPSMTVRLRKVN